MDIWSLSSTNQVKERWRPRLSFRCSKRLWRNMGTDLRWGWKGDLKWVRNDVTRWLCNITIIHLPPISRLSLLSETRSVQLVILFYILNMFAMLDAPTVAWTSTLLSLDKNLIIPISIIIRGGRIEQRPSTIDSRIDRLQSMSMTLYPLIRLKSARLRSHFDNNIFTLII